MKTRIEDPTWTDETRCICAHTIGDHSPQGRFACLTCPCRYFTTSRKRSAKAQDAANRRGGK